MASFQKIKGTQDFYGLDAVKLKYIEKVCSEVSESFGFSEMITPIFESTGVFTRLGDESDIVTKEMYTFLDRGKRSITLRPEGTAPVVRSFIENKLYANNNDLSKYYYFGPIFRYERPQAGRYRQFHQFGVEVFGKSSALLDVDVILSGFAIIEKLGIKNITLKINSIGDLESRTNYANALKKHFDGFKEEMCIDCQRRLDKNPLRILDCKIDYDKDFIVNAPKIKDYLNEDSKQYFNEVLQGLDAFKIPYEVDYNLVRGLDYYTDTVFEYIINSDDEFNNLALCAGGKYGHLVKDLNGPDIPGIGYAFGVERILGLLDKQNIWPDFKNNVDVFIMSLDEVSKLEALRLAFFLRKLGLVVEMDYKNYNMKNQFKLSDRLNADYILIIGESERQNQEISLKDVKQRTQINVKINELLKHLPFENLRNTEEIFNYENS